MPRPPLSHLPLQDPGIPNLTSPLRFLLWLSAQQLRHLTLGVCWGVVWMVAQGLVPAAIGLAIGGAAGGELARVWWGAGAVLVLGLIQSAAGILRHRKVVVIFLTVAVRIQQLVTRHATRLGSALTQQIAAGEVVAVSTSDVEKVSMGFDVTARLAGALVAFVGIATVLTITSPVLGVVVVVGATLLALSIGPLLRPLERREHDKRELVGRSSALAADTAAGLRVLRGIGGEEMFLRRFEESSEQVRIAAVGVARVRSTLEAAQVLLPGLLVVIVTWVGVKQAIAGSITIGQFVAFYGYTAFLVVPLRTITEAARKWTGAYVASKRIVRLLRLEPHLIPDRTPAQAGTHLGAVLFDTTSELAVTSGTITGVVCADQETADAFARHLAGYGDGLSDVLHFGAPLRTLPLDELRRKVLLQDKDPALFSGTLGELFNLPHSGTLGVRESVAAACALDVLEAVLDASPEINEPLEAQLTERGRSLSGGQRQRIALARSLFVDPDVLILDEPTSSVDTHTETRIAESIRTVRDGRTTVVFTTSPLLLDACDHVSLIEDGVVVAEGRHRRLLREEPRYRAVITREEVSA